MRRYDFFFLVLAGFFLSSLVLANAMMFKFIDIQLPFVGIATISIGVLPYPITFLCTDLISELYGKKRADAIVVTGFLVSVYMLLLLQLGRVLPVSHLQDETIQTHYMAVFGQSIRAILASMVAYLLAQLMDVRFYHFWRKLTHGKHLLAAQQCLDHAQPTDRHDRRRDGPFLRGLDLASDRQRHPCQLHLQVARRGRGYATDVFGDLAAPRYQERV